MTAPYTDDASAIAELAMLEGLAAEAEARAETDDEDEQEDDE